MLFVVYYYLLLHSFSCDFHETHHFFVKLKIEEKQQEMNMLVSVQRTMGLAWFAFEFEL